MNGPPDFAKVFATIADFLDGWLQHPVLPAPQQAVFVRATDLNDGRLASAEAKR